MKREAKRVAVFQPEFREDLRFWIKAERNTAIIEARVIELQSGRTEVRRRLKSAPRLVSPYYRLVYRVSDEVIDFLQARYHYWISPRRDSQCRGAHQLPAELLIANGQAQPQNS